MANKIARRIANQLIFEKGTYGAMEHAVACIVDSRETGDAQQEAEWMAIGTELRLIVIATQGGGDALH
jgi:hypothetical protein